MLPVETILPAGKQNSEIPHSSLKSRPKGCSVIEVCWEVFLSKKQQGRAGGSEQITVQSAGTQEHRNRNCLQEHSSSWIHPHITRTPRIALQSNAAVQNSVTQLLLELSLHSENFIPESHPSAWLHGADCPLHSHLQPACGILLGKIKMQRGLWEMGLSTRRSPGCHFPILYSKTVSYYLKSLQTLLLCEWFDPIARRNCFFSWREHLCVSHAVTSQAGHRDMSHCAPQLPCWGTCGGSLIKPPPTQNKG